MPKNQDKIFIEAGIEKAFDTTHTAITHWIMPMGGGRVVHYNKPSSFIVHTQDPVNRVSWQYEFQKHIAGTLVTQTITMKSRIWLFGLVHWIRGFFNKSTPPSLVRLLHEIKYSCENNTDIGRSH